MDQDEFQRTLRFVSVVVSHLLEWDPEFSTSLGEVDGEAEVTQFLDRAIGNLKTAANSGAPRARDIYDRLVKQYQTTMQMAEHLPHIEDIEHQTLHPQAVWGRIVRRLIDEPDQDDPSTTWEQLHDDTSPDIIMHLKLEGLAWELAGTKAERWARILKLSLQYPQFPTELQALALSGLTLEDAGLKDTELTLPEDLEEARALQAWLKAHPSKLPPATEEQSQSP
jgi:hypothetical protein